MKKKLKTYKKIALTLILSLAGSHMAHALTCSFFIKPNQIAFSSDSQSLTHAKAIHDTDGAAEAINFLSLKAIDADNKKDYSSLDVDSMFYLQRLYYDSENYTASIRISELIILHLNPTKDHQINSSALLALAVSHEARYKISRDINDMKKAIEYMTAVTVLNPKKLNRMNQLLALYMQAPEHMGIDFTPALELADKIAAQNKANNQQTAYRRTLLRKGRLQFRLNLLTEAEASYQEILASFPIRLSKNELNTKDITLDELIRVLMKSEAYLEALTYANARIQQSRTLTNDISNTPYLQIVDVFIALRQWNNAQTVLTERMSQPFNTHNLVSFGALQRKEDRMLTAMKNHQNSVQSRQIEDNDFEIPDDPIFDYNRH